MSISNTVSKAGPWTADGTQTVFPFLFVPLSADYVEVWVDDRIVTNALGTVYTVSVNPDGAGGSVTFLTAPTAGSKVALIRNVPASQLIDLQNNTAFLPEILEAGLDKLTILAQQYGEKAERSVVMPPTASTATPWAYIQGKLDEMGEAVEDAEDAAAAAVSASTTSQAAAQQAQQAAQQASEYAVKFNGSTVTALAAGSNVNMNISGGTLTVGAAGAIPIWREKTTFVPDTRYRTTTPGIIYAQYSVGLSSADAGGRFTAELELKEASSSSWSTLVVINVHNQNTSGNVMMSDNLSVPVNSETEFEVVEDDNEEPSLITMQDRNLYFVPCVTGGTITEVQQ